jgi:hypothetical protein
MQYTNLIIRKYKSVYRSLFSQASPLSKRLSTQIKNELALKTGLKAKTIGIKKALIA